MDEIRSLGAITEAELLAAIMEAEGSAGPVEGRTTTEWAVVWRCSECKADLLLKKAWRVGILESDRAPRLNRAGSMVRTPVYRIKVKAT